LGYADYGYAAKHIARIAALVARRAPASDQSLPLVEVDGGYGDAGARRHLADGQRLMTPTCFSIGHVLDLNFG
jgi:hypothetical protein